MDEKYRKIGLQVHKKALSWDVSFNVRLAVDAVQRWKIMGAWNIPSLSNAARATRITDFDSVYVNGFVMIVIALNPDFPQKRLIACLFKNEYWSRKWGFVSQKEVDFINNFWCIIWA